MFKWTEESQKSFETLKKKVTEAPVRGLPNFEVVFAVDYDASNWGLVLSLVKKESLSLILVRN